MAARFPFVVVGALLAFANACPDAVAQVPPGPEFRVDGGAGGQPVPIAGASGQPVPPPRVSRSSVAVTHDGEFVVVWTVFRSGGAEYDLVARRFGGDGRPRGPEFPVNTSTAGTQLMPAVAMDDAANFVVVWSSEVNGYPSGIYGQRFASSGARVGAEFSVDTSRARVPAVAMTNGGGFVVVWDSFTGTISHVLGQLYDAAGMTVGGPFLVNSSVGSVEHRGPTVDRDGSGNFIVAWTLINLSGPPGPSGPLARLFTANAVPLGPEFRVRSTFGGYGARGARSADGRFVVAWRSSDGGSYGIFARRFEAAGQPIGAEFLVNTYTTGEQSNPEVDADADGDFIVTWTSEGQDGSGDGVYGRRYTSDGVAGPEFRVNETTTGAQNGQSVASDPAGNTVTMWYSVVSSTGTVWARRHVGGLLPVGLEVDASAGPGSDGNRVLDPGETVAVAPSWLNGNLTAQTFTGAASDFTGPGTWGDPTYAIADAAAAYGTVGPTATGSCATGGDCYALEVTVPTMRPAAHWDAAFREDIAPATLGAAKNWSLHVGDSFADVPRSSGFYRFIETLLHARVTGGCGPSGFCPLAPTARQEMAVFVLMAREPPGYAPPPCVAPRFTDVPAWSPFCPWIEELARRGVVGGCGGGRYCPSAPVTREQMTVFVLGALDPALVPPPCTVPPFLDVPASSSFCPWIAELARRNVVAGCGDDAYCPLVAVTREEMSVFIVMTFTLALYGP